MKPASLAPESTRALPSARQVTDAGRTSTARTGGIRSATSSPAARWLRSTGSQPVSWPAGRSQSASSSRRSQHSPSYRSLAAIADSRHCQRSSVTTTTRPPGSSTSSWQSSSGAGDSGKPWSSLTARNEIRPANQPGATIAPSRLSPTRTALVTSITWYCTRRV